MKSGRNQVTLNVSVNDCIWIRELAKSLLNIQAILFGLIQILGLRDVCAALYFHNMQCSGNSYAK